jgi:hypothetical protein
MRLTLAICLAVNVVIYAIIMHLNLCPGLQ